MDIRSHRGSPVAVVFWASWCGFCKKELPQLVDLYSDLHERGMEIVGINVDANSDDALAACKKWGISWDNIHFEKNGPGSKDPLSKKYDVRGIPAVYLIDADGRVAASRLRGQDLRTYVEHLLSDGA